MLTRRLLLATPALLPLAARAEADPRLGPALDAAEALAPLHNLIVARNGAVIAERHYRGPPPDRPANVKSVSKSVIAALVGAAIARGHLEGPDQPIAPILRDRLPANPDPRLARITIGNLLSMQAGLERTSGAYYGQWVASRDWVRAALARPFVADPGGPMLYSTGNTHLLSAILTRVTGRSTHALARDWLAGPLDIALPPWPRDPQGIFFGGNDMLMSPRGLLRFAEMHRLNGQNVLRPDWITACWTPRTASAFTGDAYGYGWFLRPIGQQPRFYAWGFGGQMAHVLPGLGLSIAMTSDPNQRSGGAGGHARALHELVEQAIVPALA
ncbi:serine hydrolase domain-containing protein [Teichococcus deserti]|uniref:serine hydrolase domain-containing protein n=1 Tax=Teichococcus deserti TaxID=1817963 RepID=UPI000D09628B|nr:serine hydrolase [Pseudoroseomonas deserti]